MKQRRFIAPSQPLLEKAATPLRRPTTWKQAIEAIDGLDRSMRVLLQRDRVPKVIRKDLERMTQLTDQMLRRSGRPSREFPTAGKSR
jgi:uncharacterized protein YjeT (DUF2065 family)